MNLDPYLTPCLKINSKWIEDLSVRPKIIQLLEENIGQKSHDTGFGNNFLDMTPKTWATKEKQVGPNETSKLLHSKGNHKQDEKTTLRMGENICK